MFYSQFILAKKGPLGTIWIAAHLERKLRKNQVADTDIGVSVDSILFPEVPIALRLSSHLLLGVVRIYSRKVNYLFDDCSEALLKIKQAFRSTAVDLPPEESTAPYHSITLPETFDLDDFELPDNDIFQGNYVDHHVSTREQITLQDAMEGVVYSTSQFGLDERFGDGDTSQIGLDFDEDLFLGKAAAQGNDGISGGDPEALAQPTTPLEKHEVFEGVPGTSETVQMNGTGNQAPSTPGLFEEPNLSSVQEAMACNDHLDLEDHSLSNLRVPESTENACSELGPRCEDDNTMNLPENGYNLGDVEMKQMIPPVHEQIKPVSPVLECSNGTVGALDFPNRVEDINNGIVINSEPTMLFIEKRDEQCVEPGGVRLDETVASPSCSQVTSELEESARKVSSSGTCVRVPEDYLEDQQTSLKSEIQNDIAIANDMGEACTPNIVDSPNPVAHEKMASAQHSVLQACNSHLSHHGVLSPSDKSAEIPCNLSSEVVRLKSVDNAISCDNQPDVLDRSATSDLLAPEKFLSIPDGLTAEPSDLPMESTPDKEVFGGDGVDGAGTKLISGKKRSSTESTVTVQSLNSVESFGEARGKRTADSIPDDDDLLSSILVGRKSSVLKLKPTPPVPEMKTAKRSRTAVRGTASKRKVLMDDTMVLHGDTIRQQLTNTEDIRRVRKKAPCTRPEISMIQRQNLEDEIFIEPIVTGMSGELTFLHTENFDLSRTRFSEDNQDNASDEVLKDVRYSVRSNVTEESEILGSTEPVIVRDDAEAQADIVIETKNRGIQDHNLRSQDTDAQGQGITDPEESKHEPLAEVSEMEIDVNNAEVTYPVSGDIYNMPSEDNIQPRLLNKIDEEDASLQMGALCMSPDEKLDSRPIEVDASIVDASIQKGVDAIGFVEHNVEIRADVQTGFSELTDINSTLATVSLETGDNKNLSSSNDQSMEEMGHELHILNENEVLDASFGCDDKDTKSSCMLGGEDNIGSTISLELDVDAKYISFSDKENLEHEEADPRSGTEAEVTADHPAGNRGDCGDLVFGNDTEFLNVDDEEITEEGDDMPSAEDTSLLENSGWSSRTRAVAKYLQTLFDKEAVHGKKVLGMDNLLNGKTRKEASRMFFETLVLKTRDYINVDQAKPFDNINIKPRVKLMKSDF
ncbi:sister chromatid cohesion 1 protein 4 isoform X2 [Rosa rugosa]|uniref:sister chromatid cohesion 1 protein 4 isoform X2 n=1 Tax=Rosa rugosa TaxID=74645 RepID=UPI002B40F2C3|nr:sister chromatid cohesion 1 protein 4 isoform X2 [Rosa rugosa]